MLSVNIFTCFYQIDGISMVMSVNLNDFLFPAKLSYNLLVGLASFTQAVV